MLLNQAKIQDSLEIMSYPKVETNNLPVDLLVYNLETKQTIKLSTKDGKPYSLRDLSTYSYEINLQIAVNIFHSNNY